VKNNHTGKVLDMGPSGKLQVTLHSPHPIEATVSAWTLSAHVIAGKSSNEDDDTFLYVQPRIADALHVKDGDNMDVVVHDLSQRFSFPVKLRARMSSDVWMQDLVGLGVAESVRTTTIGKEEIVLGGTGQSLALPLQYMWRDDSTTPRERKGSARLYFDGVSHDSPNGPCGYGFHIVKGSYSARGDELVQGYGYAGMNKSCNEMEYFGLVEGLYWAVRLNLRNLQVFGVSETIIKQLTGEYTIKNRRLKVLYDKSRGLLDRNAGMKCTYQRIHRDENDIAESLSILGIAKKETFITCNWPNINHLMAKEVSTS
jgi:ribonuclease HI